jgi:hypothetical protein
MHSSVYSVPLFWDNLSVPFSRVVPQTSVKNYHSTLPKIPEQRRPQQHTSYCTILVTTAVQNYILLIREMPNSIFLQKATLNKTPVTRVSWQTTVYGSLFCIS